MTADRGPAGTSTLDRPTPPTATTRRRTRLIAVPELRWALLATGLFALGALLHVGGAPAWAWWTAYLACYAAGGWEPLLAGLQAARERTLDVDLLMVVAAVGAAAIGQVFDGALLIVIFAGSGALEALATRRTEDSVRALLDLAPEQAVRLRPDGTEELVDTAGLVVDDVLLVRPGELVGADAEVLEGTSEVDQASITGEPLPVLRERGDEVFAGTLNGTGALTVRVRRAAADSVLARVVAQVEAASATKARAQQLVERVEQRYSTGVVVATLALFTVPLVAGAALAPTLLRAMTFMIVASPCAVVLATMPPLLSAIATAGRHGVLVKSAVVLEQLGTVDLVALDKTGTLTTGTPRVDSVHVLGALDADTVLGLAAAAEQPSEHPLAAAVVAHARRRGLTVAGSTDFRSTPGRGVRAVVDGHLVTVGAPGPDTHPLVATAQARGRTAVLVHVDEQAVGVLELVDGVRPGAAESVAALRELTGRGPVLLTGDNAGAAGQVGAEVGIEDVRAGLLPADKAAAVAELQAGGRRVLLVGDGVNDAPAMATAHLGVAMGRGGADLALQTADVVLVRDDLAALPALLALSRRARRVVAANLVLAGTVIVALVTWDLVGTLPLPLAVAGHEGSTVLVGLNGLRLLRERAWTRAAAERG